MAGRNGLWRDWPTPEAVRQEGAHRGEKLVGLGVRVVAALAVVGNATYLLDGEYLALRRVALVLLAAAMIGALLLVRRASERRSLPLALVGLVAVVCGVVLAGLLGSTLLSEVLVFLVPASAARWVPSLPAGFAVSASIGVGAACHPEDWRWLVGGPLMLGLFTYLGRQDWEVRATTQRMLRQEREARAVATENASLAERSRIAREIHDVLAHSLSAQLVHLEAARLVLGKAEPSPEVDAATERVVAARRMARDGLAEARQALSTLRGDPVRISEVLERLAADSKAGLSVSGEARELAAKPGQAVRRVAEEALTNARKHAPGDRVTLHLRYGDGVVELVVRNTRGSDLDASAHQELAARAELAASSELAGSGSGFGLLGMRERAELLGGSVQAGPTEDGFEVTLRVPG